MADLGLGSNLYKIAPGPLPVSVVLRVACATGIPILVGMAMSEAIAGVIGASCALLTTLADIGTTYRSRIGTMAAATVAMVIGGTIGARYGGTTGAAEVIIVAAALVAGWVSGSHPGLGAVARFFAIATATGAGLHFANPMVAVVAAGGGAMAIVVAILVWSVFGVPADENVMDWRAGIRRALAGVDAGASFAIAYALAAGAALLAADWLGVERPYRATMTVLMVMRREGLESLRLVLQYMAGTLLGILLAEVVVHLVHAPEALAAFAVITAASARLGFALNPALGYAGFTAFFIVSIDLVLQGRGMPPHLLSDRLYDVSIGCLLALVATLAVRAIRIPRKAKAAKPKSRSAAHK